MGITSSIGALWLALLCTVAGQQPTARVSSDQTQRSSAAQELAEAEGLLQQQQYAAAAEKLQAVVARSASNPQAWFDLGFAQSHLNKSQDAAAAYKKAVELAPKWFEANLNLGIALAKSGDAADAVPVLKHTLELKPSSGGDQALGRAWLSLAQVEEQTSPADAIAAYDRAAALLPKDSDVLVSAGMVLEKTGDLAGAEQRFQRAAEMGNAQGMSRLINVLGKQKRYADAAAWLQKYVAQNPQDGNARVQLARLLASQNKMADAIAVLQPVSGAGADPAVSRELAELYLENKQYVQAAPLYQQALSGNPNDPELHFGLGLAQMHQLKYAEAEQQFLQAVKLKPDYAEAYDNLAYAARENKDYVLAIKALDARSKFLPEDAKTYFIRATSYDSLRMVKEAMANYKKFLEVAGGKYPDQEFQARHRLKALQPD
ncbi:MAG TPA: tetratricopeptide repeat protein [Candidatus Angelobacter sp.]|jgi:Flp pilus assembly protein TadD|nr:tetratricopeptide repeat protein [Candidatus Angelobacter sp.]HKT50766.1 tetratricopeptide repeat protein [Candidatus Angelobacter sp.]